MDAVESLLIIHIVDVQLPLPLSALLDDVVQREDLVRTSSSIAREIRLMMSLG